MITNVTPKLIAQTKLNGLENLVLYCVTNFELSGFIAAGFDVPHFDENTVELDVTLYTKFAPNGFIVRAETPVVHLVPLSNASGKLPPACKNIKLTIKDISTGALRVTNVGTSTISTQNEPKDPSRDIPPGDVPVRHFPPVSNGFPAQKK
jgi:hypothetical protein